MKHLISILTIFLLLPITLNAQSETRNEPFFILKYSPISLVSLNSAMIQFAGESFLQSNIGLQYEIGVIPTGFGRYENTYGGRIKTEIRKYQHTYFRNIKIRQFWGIGAIFQQKYTERIGTFCIPGSNCTTRITIPILQSDTGVNLYGMFGWQYFFNKHFMIEINVSGGLIRRELAYMYDASLGTGNFHYPRKSYHPLIHTGIFIGYAF